MAVVASPNAGRLHILTDVKIQQRFSHLELAKMAFDAGADVVQYREKNFVPSVHAPELSKIIRLPRNNNQRLVVNDWVQHALELHADGVHVGQRDMPVAQVLQMAPANWLVGATVHNEAELEERIGLEISYIGVGPVYGTVSKHTLLPPLGLKAFKHLCLRSPWPVIAIGGIRPGCIPELLEAGAHGVALLSAFCGAPNPAEAAAVASDLLKLA